MYKNVEHFQVNINRQAAAELGQFRFSFTWQYRYSSSSDFCCSDFCWTNSCPSNFCPSDICPSENLVQLQYASTSKALVWRVQPNKVCQQNIGACPII